ncbi:glycosyltransferase [Roseimaritima ulvae]|uniref:N-glycosyltransferase n=1 Tax=Roseimaritima ulvae TaxID=980254 RepID=A0A5B9QLS8_9BACT|nr:glycosyltransferase [Roseimaritima ulvae]QEG38979.1 N-glycosyltransferase [Roseimaritima ulvae]
MVPTNSSPTDIPLTVVIIGRNEEQFIAQSVRSALAVQPQLPSLEVIFVDSASTDRSVEIAKELPIRVLQLRPDWPLCVAAGRYTGFLHSRGQYILFLDGDAEVEAEWLLRAVGFMDQHPDYGAVAGVLDERYVTAEGASVGGVNNVFGQDLSKPQIDCKALGGIAMYRRAALEQAGTVNPHLPTGEDDELCMRLRNCGFKLARIEGRMAIKYTEQRDTIHEVLRRSRTKMYDYGAVIRHAAVYGGGWQYCWDAIPYVVTFAATLLLFLTALPIAIYFQLVWSLGVLALLLGFAVVIKKRSFHRAALSVAVRAVSTFRTVVSFIRTKPQPIEAYPTDVIHVR